jgi:hypothetical protein
MGGVTFCSQLTVFGSNRALEPTRALLLTMKPTHKTRSRLSGRGEGGTEAVRGQDDRKRERHARDGVWLPAGGESPAARPGSRLRQSSGVARTECEAMDGAAALKPRGPYDKPSPPAGWRAGRGIPGPSAYTTDHAAAPPQSGSDTGPAPPDPGFGHPRPGRRHRWIP